MSKHTQAATLSSVTQLQTMQTVLVAHQFSDSNHKDFLIHYNFVLQVQLLLVVVKKRMRGGDVKDNTVGLCVNSSPPCRVSTKGGGGEVSKL